jgi:hypothetical protein
VTRDSSFDGPSLTGPSLTTLSDDDLLAVLRDVEVEQRRSYARQLQVIAELEARGVALARGYGGIGALVREVGNHDPVRARRLVAHARAVTPSRGLSGAEIEADLPRVAEHLEAGTVGVDQVEAIRTAMQALPGSVSVDDRSAAEAILCEAAVTSAPKVVARLGREIAARLDPDGPAPSEKELARPDRWLELRQRPDGSVTGMFGLDAETGTLLTNLLSPHTTPQADEPGLDRRGRDERYGDALTEVLRLAARCPEVPSEAGEPVSVLVSVSLADLRRDAGRGLVDGHLQLPVAQVRRMACDSRVIPMVLSSQGEPLDVGRSSRTVPRAIRRALIHRDGGCTFPGCDRNAKWCQAHHIIHWADGGPTSLGNLTLLCARHHRVLHHTDWQVHMRGGRPWYRPPAYLDAHRTPRRNTLHTHRAMPGTRAFPRATSREVTAGVLPQRGARREARSTSHAVAWTTATAVVKPPSVSVG